MMIIKVEKMRDKNLGKEYSIKLTFGAFGNRESNRDGIFGVFQFFPISYFRRWEVPTGNKKLSSPSLIITVTIIIIIIIVFNQLLPRFIISIIIINIIIIIFMIISSSPQVGVSSSSTASSMSY